ncbi:MAG: hypothetical protein KKB20_04500 [Proteobacteria bacterium]|nr:hypothetical protein [Pseudomonadota bacterium]
MPEKEFSDLTALETAPGGTDVVAVYVLTASALRKVTVAELFQYLSNVDHGALAGLTDDDHTQYVKADGSRAITGNQTLTNANLIIGTAGKGIDFSATSDGGGMTSELLNDYEEGTWTPVITNITPPTTPYTMDVVTATYTKIGGLVIASAHIRTDSVDVTGASGTLQISGLPFTSTSGGTSSIYIGLASDFAGDHPIGGTIPSSTSAINLTYRGTVNGATAYCNAADLTAGASANKNTLIFTAIYQTQ